MQKRKLEELNLLDNFMFGSMMGYPEIGEVFCKKLLKIIFQRDFTNLRITPQKVYYGMDTELHGTRLDVFIEEDGDNQEGIATVYDVEPDKNSDKKSIQALPKRMRFYHSKIDAGSLQSGEDYSNLKNLVSIMITSYDPFGLDRILYTIKNTCVEEPEMDYRDGVMTLYLYTKGSDGNVPESLREFLRYMEDTREENVVNEELKELQTMVQTVKRDKEVSVAYMRLMEDERILINRIREEEQINTKREKERADREATRAEQQATRAEKAEAELKILRGLLEQQSQL